MTTDDQVGGGADGRLSAMADCSMASSEWRTTACRGAGRDAPTQRVADPVATGVPEESAVIERCGRRVGWRG